MKNLLLILLTLTAGTELAAQIQVDYATAEEAVATLLGEGVQASNITFSGTPEQLGLLSGAEGSIFAPSAGVILSCADAQNVATGGANDIVGISGDPDLLSIANDVPPLIGQNFTVSAVNDVATLEFDFIPAGDSLKFNYSFGSDEYLTWVNSSFNDIFAFFLSGPGISGPYAAPAEFPDGSINIAQVPDSDPLLPITISSVNNVLNSQYYIDNPGNIDISINGFTVVLTAEYPVECGQTYHIKLAIADGTDTALESIVCLEAGSFSSSAAISASVPDAPPSLPELTLLEGCVDGIFTVFRPNTASQDTLYLAVGGDATEIDDYLELPDFIVFPEGELTYDIPVQSIADEIAEGTETITLTYYYINACDQADTVIAELDILDYVAPTLSFEDEIFLCNGESQNVSGVPSGGYQPFTYEWSTGSSSSNINVTSDGPSQINLMVTDYCENMVEDSFIVTLPSPFEFVEEVEICLGLTTEILAAGGALPYDIDYPEDSLEYIGNNQFETNEEGFFEVTITDQCGESGTTEVTVEVCETVIPNIFSPNSDSVNDFFFIEGNDGYPGSRLEVYNRWGNMVFENANYQNNWRGEELAEGTYYYIYTRGDGERFSGEFMLVRKANGR